MISLCQFNLIYSCVARKRILYFTVHLSPIVEYEFECLLFMMRVIYSCYRLCIVFFPQSNRILSWTCAALNYFLFLVLQGLLSTRAMADSE